ncbi:MAG: serine/threonine protein kinase [Myxococcales bacterium]|nr:serine/threonine protein kinase [Myxococcales bacterium]MBL0195535.1 serine/threonine protein kinase [Myxococcales bacterium]
MQPTPSGALACPRCGATYDSDAAFCVLDGTPLTKTAVADKGYVGAVVGNDIELREIIGSGAMGRVYRGFQRGTDRDVAVKVLHGELLGRSQLVQRFCREAKIAGKLKHPHVVEVYTTGELPDGASYIVMEFLDGASLATVLEASGGKLPPERAISVARQICDAIGEGHQRGIIHRDLKPENVMLVSRTRRDGAARDARTHAHRADLNWVKVLDFGIARSTLPDGSMETAAGAIFGTARYISPECAQGETATPASDVYSLAVMLYQMLSGHTPFNADQPVGLLFKHVHDPPPPLRSWPGAEGLPPALEHVVMACLAKDPGARPQDGEALDRALREAAEAAGLELPGFGSVRGRPSVAKVADTLDDVVGPIVRPAEGVAPAPVLAEPRTRGASSPPPRARRTWAWGVAVALFAFVVGAGGAGLLVRARYSREDPAQAERTKHIERTREALTDGHYTAPPGENVSDLVRVGLQRWPNDAELKRLRSDAEHEMITMAMAARSSGDLVGARDLARGAHSLDSTDNSARFLRAQLDDDLRGIASGATVNVGAPRLVFESPPVVKPGARVEMTCRVVPGAAGAKAKISGIRVTLLPNGKTTGGAPVTLTSTDPSNVRAVVVAPEPGSYDVSFEASVDGMVVRAMRDLDVAP